MLQYYIEPKTGRKFRSMISVKRYLQLQELEADEIPAGSPETEVNLIMHAYIHTHIHRHTQTHTNINVCV